MSTSGNYNSHLKSRLNVQRFFPTESKVQNIFFLSEMLKHFDCKINILTFPSWNVYIRFVNKIRLEIVEEEVFM